MRRLERLPLDVGMASFGCRQPGTDRQRPNETEIDDGKMVRSRVSQISARNASKQERYRDSMRSLATMQKDEAVLDVWRKMMVKMKPMAMDR